MVTKKTEMFQRDTEPDCQPKKEIHPRMRLHTKR